MVLNSIENYKDISVTLIILHFCGCHIRIITWNFELNNQIIILLILNLPFEGSIVGSIVGSKVGSVDGIVVGTVDGGKIKAYGGRVSGYEGFRLGSEVVGSGVGTILGSIEGVSDGSSLGS